MTGQRIALISVDGPAESKYRWAGNEIGPLVMEHSYPYICPYVFMPLYNFLGVQREAGKSNLGRVSMVKRNSMAPARDGH